VTQVDRENAWPFIPSNSIAGTDREGFLAGAYDDTPTVHMITSIRLAASQSSAERIASLEARVAELEAGVREAKVTLTEMLPTNISLDHPRWGDGTNVPIDVSLGELRAVRAMRNRLDALLNKGSEPCPK
jgi:hypothetical protein